MVNYPKTELNGWIYDETRDLWKLYWWGSLMFSITPLALPGFLRAHPIHKRQYSEANRGV